MEKQEIGKAFGTELYGKKELHVKKANTLTNILPGLF